MSRVSLFSIFLLSIVSLACGSDYKNERTSGKSGLSYNLKGSECETGLQKLTDREAYCRALVDEKRNKSCAKEERHAKYNEQCSEYGSLEEAIKSYENALPGIAG